MTRSNIRCIASAFLALLFFVASAAGAAAQETFPSEKLEIISTAGKTQTFTVEVANSDSQRQQGLMFRKSMSDDHGMLFDFKEDRDVMMWMKNTFIPLDMLFISKAGKITHIHTNAVPHSEDIISSNGPVRYVLELNGGAAKKLGITVGDTVRAAQIR
ncbi:DUF192 domain-containing protein [Agrobacterium larrymoorei]|uniref:Uncharacterized membrane protein (UPF0127 family) n=1 Tax=Agrobacterium larrymoorei TaxID=160699 RepID=A0ABU0UMF0_9HYPH|nr:DUF192 domain-containing protein [Agrobacterium larrymoorei]MDQ1186135.1 uncharacterized membrane protein (UPF0127 family) [Agrobacterium larrymoorei]